AFAVGIQSRIKSSVRVSHFTQQPGEDSLNNFFVLSIAGGSVCFSIEAHELAVVVKHFLKVRSKPLSVDGIARKSTPDLIVNATHSDFFQRKVDLIHDSRITRQIVTP